MSLANNEITQCRRKKNKYIYFGKILNIIESQKYWLVGDNINKRSKKYWLVCDNTNKRRNPKNIGLLVIKLTRGEKKSEP